MTIVIARLAMSQETSDSRQRLVAAAADLLRRRGLNATSVRELAKHANAPLGSTYHYFPGGKQQLVSEAVAYAGDSICRLLQRELAAGPMAGLRAFATLWREILIAGDYRAGCPVVAVAADEAASDDTAMPLAAAAQAFASWQALLGASLEQSGVDAANAIRLATLIVASMEGAILLCRAQRDIAPFDHVVGQLEALVSAAIGEG